MDQFILQNESESRRATSLEALSEGIEDELRTQYLNEVIDKIKALAPEILIVNI